MEKSSRRLPSWRSLLDFGLVLAGTGFATGTGFVLKILIGRQLGPQALGIFAVSYAVMSTLSIVADLGLRYSMVTLATQSWHESVQRARAFVASAFVLKCVGGILVLSLGWLGAAQLANVCFHKPFLQPYLQIAMVGVCLWCLWDGVEGALHIRQKFSAASALRILMDSLRLVAFAFLMLHAGGAMLTMDRYLWLYYVAPAFSFGVGMLMVQVWLAPNWAEAGKAGGELIHFARGVFLYRTFTMLVLFMDSLMLSRYGTLEQVGQFEAAKGLAYALLLVSETLGMVLLPKVNLIRERSGLEQFLQRFMRYLAVFALAGLVWLLVASHFLGLFGPQFTQPEVIRTFQILVCSTLVTVPGTLLGTLLLALKRPSTLAKVSFLQLLAGLLAYPWTASQGIVPTACTGALLQLLGSTILYFRVRIHLAGDEPV